MLLLPLFVLYCSDKLIRPIRQKVTRRGEPMGPRRLRRQTAHLVNLAKSGELPVGVKSTIYRRSRSFYKL